jgi:ubiquinone/menaquinone biosynthesis C-methylase UbiE
MRGFYGRRVLPRIIDLVMRNRLATEKRRRLVPLARGRVLEVGIGSGLNLPHYGDAVRRVVGVDPSIELWRLGRRRTPAAGVRVDFVAAAAERLPFADRGFDTVVLAWTLCSVGDPRAALGEIRRVLAPEGCLLFVEHGLAVDPDVQRWQRRLTPLWSRLGGGCHLDRAVADLLGEAGFVFEQLDQGHVEGPQVFSYSYRGIARISR